MWTEAPRWSEPLFLYGKETSSLSLSSLYIRTLKGVRGAAGGLDMRWVYFGVHQDRLVRRPPIITRSEKVDKSLRIRLDAPSEDGGMKSLEQI